MMDRNPEALLTKTNAGTKAIANREMIAGLKEEALWITAFPGIPTRICNSTPKGSKI